MPNKTINHFATIATDTYLPYTRMLYHSLMRSNPNAELTVFCESENSREAFGNSQRVDFRVLPSIRDLGVKRARFDLYVEMGAGMGAEPFVYLDSDVIVLEDLSCLFNGSWLAACPEGLEGCTFIEDANHPWPGDLQLENRRYCASCLLFIPPSVRSFFERIRDLSKDDECWNRYIIPGRLYDQHFLSAMLNIYNIDFDDLNPFEFGYRGLRYGPAWDVVKHGNQLFHIPGQELVRVAIFTGQDTYFYFARMPAWLAAFLEEKASFQDSRVLQTQLRPTPWLSVKRWLETEHSDDLSSIRDEYILRVLNLCANEIDSIIADPSQVNLRNQSFFRYVNQFLELIYLHNGPAGTTWNGLNCNGAYLSPEEYKFIEKCIRIYSIKSAVETGAGETSILFTRNSCSVTSIEYQDGPWAERARAAGADVHIVPFDDQSRLYSRQELAAALQAVACDLLFVDSPIGRDNRRNVPEQFLEFVRPRYLMAHDIHRDHRNVFEWICKQGWAVIEYHPSYRGLVLLERLVSQRGVPPISIQDISEPDLAKDDVEVRSSSLTKDVGDPYAWEMAKLGEFGPFWASMRYFVPLIITNRSSRPLGSEALINVAYHWRTADAEHSVVVWDGDRSQIRPSLWPGESRCMLAEVTAPSKPGSYFLEWDLVEENVAWFSEMGYGAPLHEVDVILTTNSTSK